MKVSELTEEDVIRYTRMENAEEDISPAALLAAAKAYVRSYTGLTDEEIDGHEEISIAVLALCSDLYDNRQLAAENDKINRVVSSILGMHAVNLL